MKRITAVCVAGLFCAALTSTASAQPVDRYERYRDAEPPRHRVAEPPPRYAAPAPPPRHAVYGETYFFGHAGLFEPNDNRDGLKGYDTGNHFEFGIGSRVSPNLAIDGSISRYAAEEGPNDARVWPLTFGARLILPAPVVEPYVGVGVGLYFADLDEPSPLPGNTERSPFSTSDSDTTIGGYASIGLDAWLNPRTALNFEAKYHLVEPRLGGFDVDMSGWALSLGVRVSFATPRY